MLDALRNALIPVATGLGPMIGLLFAGSIIIETIFEIPGMGRLSWDALIGRDYSVFLALLALTAGFQLVGNLISAYYSKGCDTRSIFSQMKIGQTPDYDKYLNKLNVIKLDLNEWYQNAKKKGQHTCLINKIDETI